jgi:diguanylate cyclase (GGDEF)-like protein
VFSLLTLSLDGFAAFRTENGAEKAAQLARGVITALGAVVRDSDVVAKASDDEFYVLLPETDYLGALLFARRVRACLRTEKLTEGGENALVSAALGAATFPRDGADFDDLVHTCHRRGDEMRQSLAHRLDLSPLDFWQCVDLLLGDRDAPKLPLDEHTATRRGWLPPGLFGQLQLEMALEIARDPKARGLLYLGCGEIRSDLPAMQAFDGLPAECAIRVYLLGRRADVESNPWATPVFLDGEERITQHEFMLLYTENASYALVQRRAARGAPWGFHTSDAMVVDELVTKLQDRYDLQPL